MPIALRRVLFTLSGIAAGCAAVGQEPRADAPAPARANAIVRSAPLSLGREFQTAVLLGDFAMANAIKEAATAAGLSDSLGDARGDQGRTARAFLALDEASRARALDALRAMESGEGLAALQGAKELLAEFPDPPDGYRRIVDAAVRFHEFAVGERTEAALIGWIGSATATADLMRRTGFFRLQARMLAAAGDAAQDLGARFVVRRNAAEAALLQSVDVVPVAAPAPQAPMKLRGAQGRMILELRDCGDACHEVIGDYVVDKGETLTLQAGARVRFATGARIVVKSGGRLIARGSASTAKGWVTFLPVAGGGDYTGVRVEEDGFAELVGLSVEGALCAIDCQASKAVVVQDCWIRRCGAPRKQSEHPAVRFADCEPVVMRNCLFEGSRGAAIGIHGAQVDLFDCTIRDGAECGIRGDYYAVLGVKRSRIEGHAMHAVWLDDRSKISAVDCAFLNKARDYEILLTESPDASSFESCWWGGGSLRAAQDVHAGKKANMPRLHDGRDVKDGSLAESIFTGKPVEKDPGDAIGCRGLQLPR